MSKRIFLFVLGLLVLVAGSASAGSWNIRFDNYADQAAMDADKWVAADGMANGVLVDSTSVGTNHFLASGSGFPASTPKSMMVQQSPTEMRPSRVTEDDDDIPTTGIFSCWVYDDGTDILQFDIRLVNTTNYVGLGLRDDQVGSSTEYTYNLDGTVSNSGIARSTGWHFFQLSAGASGSILKIDGFYITTYASFTISNKMVVYTNFGNATDSNQIWVDNANWEHSGDLTDPLTEEDTIVLDKSFEDGATNWSALAGTSTVLTHITDDGRGQTLNCLDAYDAGTAGFGYNAVLSSVVPADGKYKLGFYYMNGPIYLPVTDLSVSLNGQGTVNLGSTAAGDWIWSYGETATVLGFTAGDTVTVEVSGTAQGDSLARFDHFVLIPDLTDVSDWDEY